MKFPPIRLLLIEDNPGDARLVEEALHNAKGIKFEIEWADRLSKGLERIAEGGVDVVLLDLLLPDSYGFDTLDMLHSQAPHVPVVVLTAVEDEAFALEAVKRGAQDFLHKSHIDPVSGETLVRCLRYAVDRHRIHQQLEQEREKLRSIKSQLHDLIELNAGGVAIVGMDGLVRFVNSAGERILGQTSEELTGEKFGYPISTEKPVQVNVRRLDNTQVRTELRAAETEWDGEAVHIVTMRDLDAAPPRSRDLSVGPDPAPRKSPTKTKPRARRSR